MNVQTKYLEKIKAEKIFIDIYTDCFEESLYGFLVDFNDEFILLEKFTNLGQVDGISILKRENISRIRWAGNEIETASNFAHQEKKLKNIGDLKIDTISCILKTVQRTFGYVNISIQHVDNEACFIGEIEDMDEETVVMNEYGTYLSLDRKMLLLAMEDITKIEAGGHYEENLKKLFHKGS